MQRWQREVQGGSSWVAPVAAPGLASHRPPPQAGGGREGWSTGNGQQELALSSEIEDTSSIFVIGFTGPILHGLTMVAHRLAVPQADRIATAGASFVEGLPRAPCRFYGDQEALPPVVDHRYPEGLCKARNALTGVGKCERATAHGGRRPQASMVFGLAHLDSHEEEDRLVAILCTLVGLSSILVQSHGTYLLR